MTNVITLPPKTEEEIYEDLRSVRALLDEKRNLDPEAPDYQEQCDAKDALYERELELMNILQLMAMLSITTPSVRQPLNPQKKK